MIRAEQGRTNPTKQREETQSATVCVLHGCELYEVISQLPKELQTSLLLEIPERGIVALEYYYVEEKQHPH